MASNGFSDKSPLRFLSDETATRLREFSSKLKPIGDPPNEWLQRANAHFMRILDHMLLLGVLHADLFVRNHITLGLKYLDNYEKAEKASNQASKD